MGVTRKRTYAGLEGGTGVEGRDGSVALGLGGDDDGGEGDGEERDELRLKSAALGDAIPA